LQKEKDGYFKSWTFRFVHVCRDRDAGGNNGSGVQLAGDGEISDNTIIADNTGSGVGQSVMNSTG